MFKDVYKAANDDIEPNPELLSNIISSTGETKKPLISHFRLAPIAAVLALFIILPGIINKPDSDGLNDGKQIASITSNSSPSFLLPKETTEDSTESNPVYNYSADMQEEKKSSVSPASNVVMSVQTVKESVLEESQLRSSGGGSSPKTVQEISAKEYFSNIGFSPDTLDIPDGLTANFDIGTKVTIIKSDDKTESDENTFTYSGKNYLSLTTSSNTDNALSYLDDEKYSASFFNDKKAVILYNGSIYQAYIIHSSGTAIKIETDMSEEDLKSLLMSIAKQ